MSVKRSLFLSPACLVFWAIVLSFQIVNGAEPNFKILDGKQVAVNGKVFKSTKEYFLSNYFKKTGRRCGTKNYTFSGPGDRTILREAADCTTGVTVIQAEYWLELSRTIPVVVHIIHKADGTGNLDDARIARQIEVLNEDFGAPVGILGRKSAGSGIQFELAGITRTANDNWFSDYDENGYKSALGWDPAHYCNIYVNTAGGFLGYAYFPQENSGVLDGLVINFTAFGGRNEGIAPYDQGRTVVHEMGHYLGLYHTFDGYSACSNTYTTGDRIVDTPAESEEHYSCTETYSCDTADPIHNYMNYTPDICMNLFTAEQANRMVCSLLNYRSELSFVQLETPNLAPIYNLLLQE